MDVCEPEEALQKQSTTVSTRRPLSPADNKHGTTHRSRTREVSSRYRSPSPSPANAPRRCPSPNTTRTLPGSIPPAPKRSLSAERKRPSRPSSPSGRFPSTPVQDTTTDTLVASRKLLGNRSSESLWPSTMRSLNASFQSDTGKREKPVSHALSDRTLRQSSNVTAHKQGETKPHGSRKPTPERKRSPLKGKNSADQSENSRPVDSAHSRLVDQHRWPSRIGGKVSTAFNRSVDLTTEKTSKISSLPLPRIGMTTPSLRRLSLDGAAISSEKSANELLTSSVDDNSLAVRRPGFSSSVARAPLVNPIVSSRSLPTPGSRRPSPAKSRGVSPTPSSRGSSPARVRPSSPSRQPPSSTSVLSFIADIKKGKKASNHIEDVHHVRLLYNRHLQWRYANARADAAMRSQKVKAEKILYSVWRTLANLWDLVIEKRFDLQRLRLKLKLYSVLNNQVACLNEWASIERDHANSLSWSIHDLQSSTLRIPITGGAKGDIETVKAALSSALDVMQAMGSSFHLVLSRVEGINSLVSKLADLSAQERAMLDESESLLASIIAMQIEEYSLRTHLLQLK